MSVVGYRALSWEGDRLTIEWHDVTAVYSSVWLRDNRPMDRDAVSGQRLIDVADLPTVVRIERALARAEGLDIQWSGDATVACFAWAFLFAYRTGDRPADGRLPWLFGGRLDARVDRACLPWAQLPVSGARGAWLQRLVREGLVLLSGVPVVPGTLLEVAAYLGGVLPTNYGAIYDVRTVAQPENLAYSDLGLGLHTDNPYRDPVPGFQALHVLVDSPEGGDSLFVDGFALADHLRAEAREHFDVLTNTPVPFHYRSRDAELRCERPLIRLNARGVVEAIHYNGRSMAPIALSIDPMERFYAAYRRWAMLLRDPRFQLRTHLVAGECVVFDNQRVLHGRTAFSSARVQRHLQGCYISRDSVLSTWGVLMRDEGSKR